MEMDELTRAAYPRRAEAAGRAPARRVSTEDVARTVSRLRAEGHSPALVSAVVTQARLRVKAGRSSASSPRACSSPGGPRAGHPALDRGTARGALPRCGPRVGGRPRLRDRRRCPRPRRPRPRVDAVEPTRSPPRSRPTTCSVRRCRDGAHGAAEASDLLPSTASGSTLPAARPGTARLAHRPETGRPRSTGCSRSRDARRESSSVPGSIAT